MLAGGVDYGSRSIILWEVASGKLLHELKDHGLPVSVFAWSADGRFLTSGDAKPFDKELLAEPSVKLWDAVTGKELKAWISPVSRPPHKSLPFACLSGRSRFLAAGLKDSTILAFGTSVVCRNACSRDLHQRELSVARIGLLAGPNLNMSRRRATRFWQQPRNLENGGLSKAKQRIFSRISLKDDRSPGEFSQIKASWSRI